MVVDHAVDELEHRTEARQTDQLFHALADSTRRDILTRAMDGEHSVSSLARRYPMSFAAVQKHVAVLERAGLVTKERRGREQLVRTDVDTVRTGPRAPRRHRGAVAGRVDRIDDLLATETSEPKEANR